MMGFFHFICSNSVREDGTKLHSLNGGCHLYWKHGEIPWWCVCVDRCNQKPPPPGPGCDDDEEELYESSGFCGILLDKNGPFASCHKKINPNVSEISLAKWNKLLVQTAACSACTISRGQCGCLKSQKYEWRTSAVRRAILEKCPSCDADKKGVVTRYLFFRITSKTVCLTCVSWAERGPSCAKPLKLMRMSVRTAESPLELGEMKPSAVSFSLLQYEGKRKKWMDILEN